MNMDPRSLRSFILSIVKPLKSGKAVTQSGPRASLDNLYPNNSADDKFVKTAPYGMIAFVPKSVTAFYQELYGSGYEPILLAELHAARPEPQAQGDVIFYSADGPTGLEIKCKITLGANGNLSVVAPGAITVQSGGDSQITSGGKTLVSSTGDVSVSSSGNAKVSATNVEIDGSDIKVKGSTVEIGADGLEKIVKGETFKEFFNLHYHLDAFGLPTEPPSLEMSDAELSSTVKSS